MKIVDVQPFVLRAPLPPGAQFYASQSAHGARKSLLVRVATDEGLAGWGEGGQYGPAEPVAATVTHVLAPRLIGRDPRDLAVLWEDLYAFTRDYGRASTPLEAISAIDIALWDLVGKAAGEPIYRLLGGAFRRRVQAYATGLYYRGGRDEWASTEWPAEEARRYLAEGFRAVKMKIGLIEPAADLRRVRAVRDAIGEATPLMVDANHAYNRYTAIRVGKGLEACGVHWFEEPVLPEDVEGYREVRAAMGVAIAGGECTHTRYGFRELIAGRAVDIVQPDTCCAGGISECVRIGTLASAWTTQYVPHVWGSGVALAAGLQLLATLPPCPATLNPTAPVAEPMLEFDRNPNPLRDELLREPIHQVDGFVAVPSGPGLGVEVDEAVVARYRVG